MSKKQSSYLHDFLFCVQVLIKSFDVSIDKLCETFVAKDFPNADAVSLNLNEDMSYADIEEFGIQLPINEVCLSFELFEDCSDIWVSLYNMETDEELRN